MSDWREDLRAFFQAREGKERREVEQAVQRRADIEKFFRATVAPALEALKTELERYGRTVSVKVEPEEASILVRYGSAELYYYRVKVKEEKGRLHPYPEAVFMDARGQKHRGSSAFGDDPPGCDIADLAQADIIRHFLGDYKAQLSRHAK